jgi:hypothetical protein
VWEVRRSLIDQQAEPFHDRGRVQRGVPQSRATEAWKIGNDDPMVAHQLRDNAGPFLREPTYPMQQDDGCAGTTVEHRGRDSGNIEPAVRDRQAIQELREVSRGVPRILGAPHPDIRPSRVVRLSASEARVRNSKT